MIIFEPEIFSLKEQWYGLLCKYSKKSIAVGKSSSFINMPWYYGTADSQYEFIDSRYPESSFVTYLYPKPPCPVTNS